MKKPKIRKEKLSIYLAKKSTEPDSSLIKVEGAKSPIPISLDGIDDAVLYIKKQPPKTPPTWTRLFTDDKAVNTLEFGTSSSVGAAFIVRAFGATFVLSFGTGFHLINQEQIERDFGLKVTLNSVDPDKLRSLDKASYDHNPLNSRTQSTRDVDIFNLRLDSELEMVYAITGASQVGIFGSHVTGRDALTIAVETSLANIPNILRETLVRYGEKLPNRFSWFENINRVRDLQDIDLLDLHLNTLLSKGDYENLWLGEPEIIDWENQIGYSFDMYQKTPRHPLLSFDDYISYLDGTQPAVDLMKSHSVHINDAEYKSVKNWSVYRCLYAEISYEGDQCILRNGVWWKVNKNYESILNEYLSNLEIYSYKFPLYQHDREENYNKDVCNIDDDFCLMDKKNINIGGPYDKVEHCDLIRNGNEFVHVKMYRSSSTLSHLFFQGFVAAEAFVKEAPYREKLNPKLPASIKLKDPKANPNPANYKIVYAIATLKKLPIELPFFSKVTLKNTLKSLRAYGYKVAIAKIGIDRNLIKKKKYKPNTP